MIAQMLYTLACTVLFCLGLNLITSEGYILHFLKMPWVDAEKRRYDLKHFSCSVVKSRKLKIFLLGIFIYVGKPVITCITCYGSVWGVAWFVTLNGLRIDYLPYIIINSFAACFLNTFIWKLYDRLDI